MYRGRYIDTCFKVFFLLLEPDYEQALNNLGNLFRAKGQLLAARELLSKAVRDLPEQHIILEIILTI